MNSTWHEAENIKVWRKKINHADNSVSRSQPEALIIHTYMAVKGWQPWRHARSKTHHLYDRVLSRLPRQCVHTHTHTQSLIHVSREMIYFNRVLDLSCNKYESSGQEKGDNMGWSGEKNKSHSLPACVPASASLTERGARSEQSVEEGW